MKGAKNENALKRIVEDNQFFGFNIGASLRSGCGVCPGLMERCFAFEAADDQGTYDSVYYQTGEDSAIDMQTHNMNSQK